jgi:hypothetical protein
VAGAAVIESVDELDPPDATASEDGLRSAPKPGGADATNETVPLNPLSDVTVTVELPEFPVWIVKVDGDAEIEKSGVATGA